MLYQQGDILIEAIDKFPRDIRPIPPENGRYILSRGEATGHAHAVLEPIRLYCQMENKNLFCASMANFTVQHEEHLPITIPAGLYVIRPVREFDYFVSDEKYSVSVVAD